MPSEMKQTAALAILRAALDGIPADVNADFQMDAYLQFALSQQVETLFIAGLMTSGCTLTVSLRDLYIKNVLIGDRQMGIAEELYALFSAHHIDYMPLKGCTLKALYPAPEMRSMGDIDILVRTEQYDQIRPLMLANDYIEDIESDHEYIWNKKGVHVELHKRLIPSYNKDYYAYFGEGWQLAEPVGEYRYEMSHEDAFVYLFTHYAKHYRDAGVGIRQALDLYVYRKTYSLNEEYVLARMQLLQLDRFYANTMHMLNVWFGSDAHTEASKLISDRLFSCGVFGRRADGLRSAMLKQTYAEGSLRRAKALSWLKKLFLPYHDMCKKYEILKKAPPLLPVMWLWRWMDVVVHKQDSIRRVIQDDAAVSDENIKAYQEMLHKSGLDFNFK